MTTIKDVAKQAGVSITAASYALNNTGTISANTRERVLAAAEELNYHPNAFARHLKKRKTRTLGVFITRFGGSFYEEILEGIHDAVLQTDYELVVCPDTNATRRILTHRQVDGAIVFDSKIKNQTLIRLASKRFPIVVLDRDLQVEYLYPVLLDNKQGAQAAFDHLYSQGARRLAFIAGAPDSLDNAERLQTFAAAAESYGLSVRVYPGSFTEQSGYDAAHAIFAAPPLPEAVFCANDQMAIGLLRAMQECGLSAPNDIAVVGFDDIQVARYMHPSLSTVGASRRLWGSLAAASLIRFLENEQTFIPQRIATELMIRQSSTRKAT